MAALSGYFEDAKKKAERASGVSPYATSAGGDAGSAPVGGGAARPASASAPTAAPTKGSGSGFVNFGSYFGANAPAIQAQAQKSVEQAKGTAAPTATPGFTAQAMPTTMRAGAAGNVAVQGTPRANGSYESRIAEASRQFEGLNPAAQTGAMGEGTSFFDQMLGGGVTQRAAQQEQQRLGALRRNLEGEYAQQTQQDQERAAAEQRAKDAQEQDARQKAEEAARQEAIEKQARDLYAISVAGQSGPWESLSEQEKEQYRRVYATAR